MTETNDGKKIPTPMGLNLSMKDLFGMRKELTMKMAEGGQNDFIELQRMWREDSDGVDFREARGKELNNLFVALMRENLEFLNEIQGTKRWKFFSPKNEVRSQQLEEYVDMLFIWLEKGFLMGFTPEEVSRAFVEKYNFNLWRNDWDAKKTVKTD